MREERREKGCEYGRETRELVPKSLPQRQHSGSTRGSMGKKEQACWPHGLLTTHRSTYSMKTGHMKAGRAREQKICLCEVFFCQRSFAPFSLCLSLVIRFLHVSKDHENIDMCVCVPPCCILFCCCNKLKVIRSNPEVTSDLLIKYPSAPHQPVSMHTHRTGLTGKCRLRKAVVARGCAFTA